MEQQPQRNTDHSTTAKRSTGKAITEKKKIRIHVNRNLWRLRLEKWFDKINKSTYLECSKDNSTKHYLLEC